MEGITESWIEGKEQQQRKKSKGEELKKTWTLVYIYREEGRRIKRMEAGKRVVFIERIEG